MSTISEILLTLFATPPVLTQEHAVVSGQGYINDQPFHILGVNESIFLGVKEVLVMTEKVIGLIEAQSKAPLLLLVDVAGQRLSMRDEWLGLNQYFAHLLSCLAVFRQQGRAQIAIVYNQAVGGSFIAFGLMADTIIALPEAKLAVMWLEAIAKITKIDIQALERLSQTVPVFAPGVENFYQLGGLHQIVALPALKQAVLTAAQSIDNTDNRAHLGYQRTGRKLTWPILKKMANYFHDD